MAFDGFGFVARNNAKLTDSRSCQPPDDVFQDGPTGDWKHRFWAFGGQMLHPRSFASGQDNCL